MKNEAMPVLYFISDIHLGLQEEPEERRKLDALSRLFAEIRRTGGSLYMLGDVFDYWMEFSSVVPKGFTGFFVYCQSLSGRASMLPILQGTMISISVRFSIGSSE